MADKILDVSNFEDGTSVVWSENEQGQKIVSHMIPENGYPQGNNKSTTIKMSEVLGDEETDR